MGMIPSTLVLLPFLAAGAAGPSERAHDWGARLHPVSVLAADWQNHGGNRLVGTDQQLVGVQGAPDGCSPGGALARLFADAHLVYRFFRGTGLSGGPHLVLHFEAGGTCEQAFGITTNSWRPFDPLFRGDR
jgi:hypothetical protein